MKLFFDSFSNHNKLAKPVLFVVVALTCGLNAPNLQAAISYVQGNYASPQSSPTTVGVTFSAAQVSGDLNVVAVGWSNSTATVSAVSDSLGNVYTRAVGPTVQAGIASQSIYYAKNITSAAAGANTVTVTFSSAAAFPDVRILEYSGADPNNPIDIAAASSGNSATASSGTAVTTNATDLLFGANLVQTVTTGAGSGFTKRLLTAPDGDIAEDRSVTTAGSYSATAPVKPSGQWIMQMVAFRTPSGGTTPPTVSSVSPNSGSTAGGMAVSITGANFTAGATVKFGGTAATNVVIVNSATITATSPSGNAGAVTVTVSVNGQSGSLTNGFTYVATPTVSSVLPNSGSTAGGTAVTVTGTNFAAGATVAFGGTAATSVVVVSSTSITATSPAHAVGAVTVTVTVSGQSGSLANGFSYTLSPTVTSVSPNSGSTAGGTAVTITGTNFAAGGTVTFGGAASTNVAVLNSTTITAATPPGSAGAVIVTVTVNGQSGSITNGFTYVASPTVSSVSPNSGSTAGGTAVTITGTNFAAGATVTFGGTAATNVVVVNSTSITATSPVHALGAVTVTVTVSGQSGSLTNAFNYVVLSPTVSSVSPNSGATAGGTAVTITGTNFGAGASVTFGGTAATNVVVVSGTNITATTPAGGTGAVTVTVTENGQSGSLANGFSYTLPPTVSTVSPNSGSTAGGTAVTITGTNFAAGGTVMFGGAAATNVVVVNSTTITAATPSGSAGAVTVTVTINGQSASLTNGFSYITTPTVSSVSPNSGPTAGGTAVTINGTNFGAGASVTFGGMAATNVVVVSGMQITATTPAGSAGAVTVAVIVNGQGGSLANGFSYTLPPTVSGVSPNSGSTAGGTAVTITGTNFAAGATVTFGGTTATNVAVVNGTTITATTPSGSPGTVAVTVTARGQSGTLTSAFTYVVVSAVSFVQGNYASPQSPQTSVNVTFTAAQAAGHLNVVVVGWSDSTATVSTISDKSGNTYTRAVGPTVQSGVASQTIYYAKNIAAAAAGANFVTVTFSVAAIYPDIRILEYSGADPVNPVDVTAASSGTSATSNSGAATTTNATDLLFSANLVQTNTTGPGSGFTSRMLTSPDGDIAEDELVTVTGSYSASAPVSPSGQWIMQMVAFRTPSAGTTSPTVSSLSPNSGSTAGGAAVTITGANFATGATVNFGGTAATNVVVVNSTTITATTPSGSAGAVTVTVTVNGQSGSLTNGFTYVASPTVSSVSPNSGSTAGGTAVTITGTNFAAGAAVMFGGTAATNVMVVNTTSITATSPAHAVGGVTLTVTVSGQNGSLTNAFSYTILSPTVSIVSPNNGSTAGGTGVTITGTNFAAGASVTFGATAATNVLVVSGTNISAATPPGSAGAVTVAVTNPGALTGNLANGFTYVVAPTPTAPTSLAVATGGLSPTYVNGQGYYNSTSLTSHTTAPFDSTGGDLIFLFASSHAGVTFTPSDSFGNTWISVAGPTSTSAGFDLRSEVWYAPSPIVGPGHTITMNLSLAQPLVMSIAVVKGSNISSPIDAISLIGSDNGTATVNVTSPSMITTTANDLLVGFVKTNGTETFAAGLGYTLQPSATVLNLTAETESAATPGTYDATFFLSTGVTWQSVVGAVNDNPNQSTLSWTGSTETGGTISDYLVERCEGSGCSSFVLIGTAAVTTFNDVGLTASTSYSYRVRAQDTAGTLGPYSSIVTITTAVPIPALPGNLTATAASTSQINLSWVASTESGGTVSSYLVERCQGAGCSSFAQIGTSATAAFIDTGVAASTSYTYRVRAMDTAGSLSPYSNLASVITQGPPTAPTNLIATAASATQINLSWTASSSSIGLANYIVQRCQGTGCTSFAQVASVAATSTTYVDTGLVANTSYSYQVQASDTSGGLSPFSNVASSTTLLLGTTISYVQGNYATPQTPQTTISVKFNSAQASGDLNVVVVGWSDSTSTVNAVTDTSGNTYTLGVGLTVITGVESQCIYYARNIGAALAGGNTVTVTFSSAAVYPDIRILEYSGADSVNPVDVTAASSGSGATSSSAVTTTNPTDLLFAANTVQTLTSSPGSGFTSRLLTVPDGDIAEDRMVTVTGSYGATAALSSGQWIMQMVAFRTPSGGGTLPPTAPGNLTATAPSTSQINLTWTASTTTVGLANYVVQRCQGIGCSNFAQVAAPTGTIYSDANLAANTSFSYRVQALDTVGNVSPFSNTATATTGSAGISISPRVASLTFTRTQQFTTNGTTSIWSVDGIVGGSASTGTITTAGLYSPPGNVGTHIVTVATADQSQSATATVYISDYAGMFTYHNDNSRTGQNLNETVLSPANLTATEFGKLFTYALDGQTLASPLYVANVSIPGQGFHNVIYAATEHDSVYAYDADGVVATPLWQVSFINPVAGITTIPATETDQTSNCCDLSPEVGITSTPVIDQTTGTLYLIAATKEVAGSTTKYLQRLHALDMTTGAEKFGGPVVIQASVAGTGDGSSSGTIAFNALRQGQRPALLLNNGILYLGFGGHDDVRPYHGWILLYNAATLQQTGAYNVTPDGYGGGVWQSGGGLTADASGNVYFATGNGTFDVSSGGLDYGDTIEKLNATGSPIDYFTPHDQANMEANDLDLGSAGPVLLVDQPGSYPHLLVSAGKTGTVYVVNRDNLGHYNPNNDGQIVESLISILPNGTNESGNYSAPVYFNGLIYFCAVADAIKAFQLNNGLLSQAPISQSPELYGFPGAAMAVSANGSANGILWAIERNDVTAPGVLHAYDAGNLSNELYNSSQAGSRDTLDYAAKFNIPLVANGKVFVASMSQLSVYGLLP